MYECLQTYLPSGVPWLESPLLLAARLGIGLMFAISGAYKLFDPQQHETMEETLDDADIPEPTRMSYFVSANELVFGLLLVVGLGAIFAALVLLVITFVAFVTQGYEERGERDVLYWLSVLLMKHQILLAIILASIIVLGPGRVSLDALLFAPV